MNIRNCKKSLFRSRLWNNGILYLFRFKFKFKSRLFQLLHIRSTKIQGTETCWAYLSPSFDHNIHIHGDLIIGKTVIIKQEHSTRRPLEDLGDCTDDNATLFQVMAWCPLATNHYLIQCCPRSVLSHDITGPQWVNKYIVMSRMINYTYLICYALGNLYAYMITLICSVKMQYDISYEHRNEETSFDQLNIYLTAVWIFLWITQEH